MAKSLKSSDIEILVANIQDLRQAIDRGNEKLIEIKHTVESIQHATDQIRNVAVQAENFYYEKNKEGGK